MTSSQIPQAVVDVTEIKVSQYSSSRPKSNPLVAWCSANWRAVLAEGCCTTMLVVYGCLSCIPVPGLTEQSPLYIPLGFGFAGMTIIQIFGHISGAYMNPAVTLASVIWGNTSVALGVCFAVAQCLGAFIGYGIVVGLSPVDVIREGICVPLPHHELTPLQAVGLEIIFTATLVFVCCSLWDPVNKDMQDSMPIKFGITVAGLIIAGGPLTGAILNPARTLGPALWTGIWTLHWVYWVGPLTGSSLATLFYKFAFLQS